ncbi:phosphoribosyl pyrophosphate synthase isozyme 4 [Pelomyxa schiedti]|nr:phosphoribosyl pyrophosphate synthase isozyme 4 [Pelomyxa schiedti]
MALPGVSKIIRSGEIEWKKFPDQTPNVFIADVNSIRNKHVVFIVGLLDQTMLMSVIGVLFALPRYFARSLTVYLPFFSTGTMERVSREGEIATARTIARIISATPITHSGPVNIVIVDIHALAERFYFADTVIPLLTTATPLVVEKLNTVHQHEQMAVCFPDEGSYKRFGGFFSKWENIICAKVRDGDRRIVKITEGNPTGKHVLIVDDLVQTGGTLIECKDALFTHGATAVSASVAHCVFPNESWRKFLNPPPTGVHGFTKFYVTDSCASVAANLKGKDPFEVMTLAPLLLDAITRYCF